MIEDKAAQTTWHHGQWDKQIGGYWSIGQYLEV